MKSILSLVVVPGVLLVSSATGSLSIAQTTPPPVRDNLLNQINGANSIQQPAIFLTPNRNSEEFFQQDYDKLQFLPLETEPILEIKEETFKKKPDRLEQNDEEKKIQEQ